MFKHYTLCSNETFYTNKYKNINELNQKHFLYICSTNSFCVLIFKVFFLWSILVIFKQYTTLSLYLFFPPTLSFTVSSSTPTHAVYHISPDDLPSASFMAYTFPGFPLFLFHRLSWPSFAIISSFYPNFLNLYSLSFSRLCAFPLNSSSSNKITTLYMLLNIFIPAAFISVFYLSYLMPTNQWFIRLIAGLTTMVLCHFTFNSTFLSHNTPDVLLLATSSNYISFY